MSDEEEEFQEPEDLPVFDEEEEEEQEGEVPVEELIEEEAPVEEEGEPEPVVSEEAIPEVPEEPMVAIDEIPMTVSVEVGRLQMNAEKLLRLQPGNLLELATQVDGPVDLVVNGKKVGQGELMKVGDSFGVRILRLG